jgi:glycogen debranching enzyme
MYAAADSTPLFLMAMLDYAQASGDLAFLAVHRDAIEKAWAFETGHAPDAAHGGNGIYTNEQGTGWVESWPGGMPHQEIYLALLDQQASAAMAQIQDLLRDSEKADAARQRATTIARTINTQFYDADKSCYAFSRNKDGSLDRTTTVYPALAWWSDLPGTSEASGAHSILAHPDLCLQQLAAHTLNTDWGLRDVSNEEKIYDGMSYHQGSVWPLFTGWAAMAEYRGNQPLAGFQMLKENTNLTWAQDLGADTELLSGDFFVPFGRSTSHQLWSSAMVITPTLRGLFGISVDAQTKTITVNPHLPPSWAHASVRHLAVGNDTVDLLFARNIGQITVQIKGDNKGHIKLLTSAPGSQSHGDGSIDFPPPAVAIELPQSVPLPGSRTSSVRVLGQKLTDNRLTILLEGPAESEFRIPLFTFLHLRKLNVSGADLQSEEGHPSILVGRFPPGSSWKTITVTLSW